MSLWDYFTRRDDGRAEPRIEPLDVTQDAAPGTTRLAGIIGASAVAGLIAVVAQWEGKRNDPYRDLVGVWTVCYGETRVAMRRYTDAECKDMLANGLADFAGPVLARNPELKGHDPQLIAATSLAYNIGPSAYARSSVARNFSDGRWYAACNAFMRYNMAGGCVSKGLVNRRAAERALCLRGL